MATTTTDTQIVGAAPAAPVSTIRQALDATVPRLCATLRAAPNATIPIKGMRWRVGELGAHIAQTAVVFTQATRGEVTAYGEHGDFNAKIDQRIVDELPERDPARLADLTEERYAELRRAFADRSDDELLPRFQSYSVAGLNAIWVIDLSVHGYQIGRAVGRPFRVDNRAFRLALETAIPFAFDPAGARGLYATYALHIQGTQPIVYTVEDGTIRVERDGAPVDCHLGVDPVAFLLVTLGVMPQWQAALTFKMRAWGRRPWLAMRVTKIFPTVPHGGIA
jgi:uncharacterized protein (TIGR03083 family)